MALKIIISALLLIIVLLPAVLLVILNRNVLKADIGIAMIVFAVSVFLFPLTIIRLVTKSYHIGEVVDRIGSEFNDKD